MFVQDTRYAARRLRRTPGFTLAVVLTLGLGIGGATAVFSVLRAVVLRPLPFPEPDRLVRLHEITPQGDEFSTSEPNFLDFHTRGRTVDDLAAFRQSDMTLTGIGEAEGLRVTRASRTFFTLTGGHPLIGRTFHPDEDRPGGTRVVVLSHALWQRRFGGERGVLGQRLTLDGDPFEVVGVMPSAFLFPAESDAWIPLAPNPASARGNHMLRAIGRLRPGASLEDARADLGGLAKALSAEYPRSNGGWTIRLEGFADWLIGPQVRQTLFVLFGAAALLLGVACVNVANLVTVRATARRREVAIEAALGASRLQIVRGLLIESLLLAFSGGAIGVLLAYLGVPVLRRLAPASVPRLDEASVDATVLLLAFVVSAGVGVCFGVLPALLQARARPLDALRESGGASSGTGRRRLRELLVAGELALAMMLLVGAALLVDSFRRLQAVDVGFDATNVIGVEISLRGDPYRPCNPATQPGCVPRAAGERRAQYYLSAAERLRALPGVVSVGATSNSPLGGGSTASEVTIEGYVARGPDDEPFVDWRVVTSGFFRAMALPIVRGRGFTAEEDREDRPVVIVTEALARRFWGDADPIGRRVSMGKSTSNWMTVVGVARDLRDVQPDLDPRPVVFLPHASRTLSDMTLVVRTQGQIDGLASALRRELQSIDRAIPVPDPYPLLRNVGRSVAAPRFGMLLMGLFAGVALVLAALGVYGVTAYAVALRTREIGVRLALGAEPGQMVRLIAGRGLLLAAGGIVAGSLGAVALSRFLERLLFETQALDPRAHVLVAGLLLAVAIAAILLPARRASRIDPRQALLTE